MKVVIFAGHGHVGAAFQRHLPGLGHDVRVVARSRRLESDLIWDGKTLGNWVDGLEDADAVINLAGKSVNCRYNEKNLDEMMRSRTETTELIGKAIESVGKRPKVWINASTATIYSHRFDKPNDDIDGIIDAEQSDAPRTWRASIKIAKEWEASLWKAVLPDVRRVAMRSGLTMSIDKGSVFDVFCGLARKGLFGKLGNGKHFVSWVHEVDHARAIDHILRNDSLEGAVNITSPNPLPQAEFARELRQELGIPLGLPAAAWMVEIGTWVMRTESELVMKSRYVTPTRLLQSGFTFEFPTWKDACHNLVETQKNAPKA